MGLKKFRLKAGSHVDDVYDYDENDKPKMEDVLDDRTGQPVINPKTRTPFQRKVVLEKDKLFVIGDVLTTNRNMDKEFGYDKWQRLDDDASDKSLPPIHKQMNREEREEEQFEDELASMTVAELKGLCLDRQIPLGGHERKAEIVEAIRKQIAGDDEDEA